MAGIEVSIETIAARLKEMRGQGKRMTLFLGSQAGVLYSDDCLYKVIKRRIQSSQGEPTSPDRLSSDDERALQAAETQLQMLEAASSIEKFNACYSILKNVSERGIHRILTEAFSSVPYREEDELLGGLIKANFFDFIITTNIDTLLEDTCEALWNIHAPDDYQVIRCGIDESEKIQQEAKNYGCIVKLFGDLSYLQYNAVDNELDLDAEQVLKDALNEKLSGEIIVVGYDPVWDRPIERAFRKGRKRVWYVNEEYPASHTYLASVLASRKKRYLIGEQGSYGSFIKVLSYRLGIGISRNMALTPLPTSHISKESRRKKVFISYSHENREYLHQLETHLKRYIDEEDEKNVIDIWEDTSIPSEAKWKQEIEKSLENAKVIILLISADFLASENIRKYELQPLLEVMRAEEVIKLSVLLGPCAFERTPLRQYRAVNNVAQPLIGMDQDEQDLVWAKLAELVSENISS